MTSIRTRTTFAATLAVSALALALPAQAQQQRQAETQGMRQQAQQAKQGPMEYRQVRGTVVDARSVPVRGTDKMATLVLLQTENGNRAVADLGTERIGLRLKHGDELAVRGRPVTIGGDRFVLQANAISYNGKAYDVNRPAMRRTGNAMSGPASQGQRPAGAMAINFGAHDANGDQLLGRRELANALMAGWDRNGDGKLSMAEFDRGTDRTFGEQSANFEPAQWDRDGNGAISAGELRQTLRQTGIFGQMDRDNDGLLSPAEFRVAGDPNQTVRGASR